jgi:hypothetical protein
MAPAASITVECPSRAAHGALAVTSVQLTPAAKRARTRPMARTNATRAGRTHGRARAAGRSINTASPRRDTRGPTQPRGALAQSFNTHTITHVTHKHARGNAFRHKMKKNTHMRTCVQLMPRETQDTHACTIAWPEAHTYPTTERRPTRPTRSKGPKCVRVGGRRRVRECASFVRVLGYTYVPHSCTP